MTKRMRLGVFEVAAVQVGGTLSWPHPRSRSIEYRDPKYWVEVAKLLDDAGFDFLFFAGGYGYPTVRGALDPLSVTGGINFPGIDPSYLLPILAYETKRLGFVFTSGTGLDHPVQTARTFSTLDHLTGGRIGWNIVTGASQDAIAALFGHDEMRQHDDRYDQADEYLELALRFWQTAWDDGAVEEDREAVRYADPDKVHKIEYAGEYYRSAGWYAMTPSPQRTPVLFQAGTSARGRAYAAHNAECVFVQGTTVAATKANVADIRARAAEEGRDPDSIRIMVGVTVTVGETHEAAVAQRAEFDALQTDDVVNVLYSGNTGIDLLSLDPDRSLEQIVTDPSSASGGAGRVGQMGQSNIDRFLPKDGSPAPTVRQILDQLKGRGTRGFQVTGSVKEVADRLESLMDETDLDGFLLEPIFAPTDLEDFAHWVVPELRRRGRLPEEPSTGTLREQLIGNGAHLSDHFGARLTRSSSPAPQ